MQDDGPAPGPGIVIERVCNGRSRKEAYTDSNGDFSFQLGGRNNVLQDASDSYPQPNGVMDGMSMRSAVGALASDPTGSVDLTGCELRARLAGYRSSVIALDNLRSVGQVNVGNIVLRSTEKVPGTTVSVTSMQAPKTANKALLRAQEDFRKQHEAEGEKELHKALDSFPGFAAAWLELGNLHQRQRRLDDARGDYMKAIEVDKNFVGPYIELGRVYTLKQNWAEAATMTDKAIALDPIDFPEGFLLNSLANFNMEKLDEAERSALRVQRLDGTHRFPLVHIILAGIYERRKDSAAAADQLRDYLKYAPGAANEGQVRARLEKLESAPRATASNLPSGH